MGVDLDAHGDANGQILRMSASHDLLGVPVDEIGLSGWRCGPILLLCGTDDLFGCFHIRCDQSTPDSCFFRF